MEIKTYSKQDERQLFDMIKEEGDDWKDYHGVEGRNNYLNTLNSSVTYVAYDDSILCGYARCREDDGFGIYVYDLLIKRSYRGKHIGKKLMEKACKDFKDQPVYVMSGIDPYYEKFGYRKEGSIFEVTR